MPQQINHQIFNLDNYSDLSEFRSDIEALAEYFQYGDEQPITVQVNGFMMVFRTAAEIQQFLLGFLLHETYTSENG